MTLSQGRSVPATSDTGEGRRSVQNLTVAQKVLLVLRAVIIVGEGTFAVSDALKVLPVCAR
jgi:hypothetical protein